MVSRDEAQTGCSASLLLPFSSFFYFNYLPKNGLTMTTMTDDDDEAFLNYYVTNDGLR